MLFQSLFVAITLLREFTGTSQISLCKYFRFCASYRARELCDSAAVLGLPGLRPDLSVTTSPVSSRATVECQIKHVPVILNLSDTAFADYSARRDLFYAPSHDGTGMNDSDDDDPSHTMVRSCKRRNNYYGMVVVLKPRDPG